MPKTKEEKLAVAKAWKSRNKEKIKEYRKKYFQNNKNKEIESRRQWKNRNPERAKELDKKWRDSEQGQNTIKKYREEYKSIRNQKAKEKYHSNIKYKLEKNIRTALNKSIKLYNKKMYRHDQKAKVKLLHEMGFNPNQISKIVNVAASTAHHWIYPEQNKLRQKKKSETKYWAKYEHTQKRKDYENSLKRKLAKNHRCRIRQSIKNNSRNSSSKELLGCSIDFLKKHLEQQFQPGMSWENYGQWHIDHKRPCCSFDLSDPKQQKQCFNYTNLQPLWAKDNLSKGGKWEDSKNDNC